METTRIPVPAGITCEHLARDIRKGYVTLNEVLEKYILKELHVKAITSWSTPRVYDDPKDIKRYYEKNKVGL